MKNCVMMFTFAMCLLVCAEQAYPRCRVRTQPVNFGSYSVFSPAPMDSSGLITIRCANEPPVISTVSIGPSPTSGVFNPRQMGSATADNMNYNFFTDATYTSIWGDGTGITSTVSAGIGGSGRRDTNLTVYGRIPPLQDVSTGSYSDSLTVTVNW